MQQPVIKICGIQDPNIALTAAQLGASYIGFILNTQFRRAVNICLAKEICMAARQGGATPIAVFIDTDLNSMQSACDELKLDTIQCHDANTRIIQQHLPDTIHRLFVVHINDDGSINNHADEFISMNKQRDYYLFDGVHAGSGQTINLSVTNTIQDACYFIAGGLNPNNVKQRIALSNPYGVDVSSGVEDSDGQKQISLIEQFIIAARGDKV